LTADIADDVEPMIVVCHCLDCQRRSGSPFGEIAYYPEAAVVVFGEAREFRRPTDQGNTFTTGFCPTCGSTVYARASKYPAVIGTTVGTIADPAFPLPARSVYEQSRHAWLDMPPGVPRHPRGRDS
jgi:hypothetical protein